MGFICPFLFLVIQFASLSTIIVSDLWKYNSEVIPCSNRGSVDGNGNCLCSESEYFGDDCLITSCNGVFSNTSDVCSSHGICIEYDQCVCSRKYFGLDCNITTCYGTSNENSESCGLNGDCTGYNNCTCSDGYAGEVCSDFLCFGILSTDNGTCSSHGVCEGVNDCNCQGGYTNESCNVLISLQPFNFLNGNDSNESPPDYSTPHPGSRASSSNFFVDALNRFWFFGSYGVDEDHVLGLYNDLWYYDTRSSLWVYEKGISSMNGVEVLMDDRINYFHDVNIPLCRCCHGFFGSGTSVFVHGGVIGDPAAVDLDSTNDLWEYEMYQHKWRKLMIESDNSTTGPRKRSYHNFVNNDLDNGKSFLFGGIDFARMEGYNDLWEYDISSNEFTFLKGDQNTLFSSSQTSKENAPFNDTFDTSYLPIPRGSSQAWSLGGHFYLFSGMQFYGGGIWTQDDMWVYNSTLGMWNMKIGYDYAMTTSPVNTVAGTNLYDKSNRPAARGGGATWMRQSELYFFGGGVSCDHYLSDIWSYSITNNQFKMEEGALEINPTYDSSVTGPKQLALAGLGSSQSVLIFGGYGPGLSTPPSIGGSVSDPGDPNNMGDFLNDTGTETARLVYPQYLRSSNGDYSLFFDGKLKKINTTSGIVEWETPNVIPGDYVVMQDDCNVVMYNQTDALWVSNTSGNPGCVFKIQDDGNLVVYDGATVKWALF